MKFTLYYGAKQNKGIKKHVNQCGVTKLEVIFDKRKIVKHHKVNKITDQIRNNITARSVHAIPVKLQDLKIS